MSKESTARSAMKLALEALESGKPMFDAYWGGNQHDKAITALRSALAEQPAQQALDKKAENARELGLDYEPAQQEPVAWQYNGILHEFDPSDWATGPVTPLYTSPPAQRKPLTDEEERKHFEYWYSTNAFDYESNPIGSRECGLQWQAWKARAAHNIKKNT